MQLNFFGFFQGEAKIVETSLIGTSLNVGNFATLSNAVHPHKLDGDDHLQLCGQRVPFPKALDYLNTLTPTFFPLSADVPDGFNLEARSGLESGASSTSMTRFSVETPSPGLQVAIEGSALSSRAQEMFQQATGYTMIRSSEGVTFADTNGEPPPADKLAMLKAASTAFSTASTNGHPLFSGISLHTDNLETSVSQIGVQSGDLEMYEDLMSMMNKILIS